VRGGSASASAHCVLLLLLLLLLRGRERERGWSERKEREKNEALAATKKAKKGTIKIKNKKGTHFVLRSMHASRIVPRSSRIAAAPAASYPCSRIGFATCLFHQE